VPFQILYHGACLGNSTTATQGLAGRTRDPWETWAMLKWQREARQQIQ